MKTSKTTTWQKQWIALLVCCLSFLFLSGCRQNEATVSAPTAPSAATSSHSSHATPAATEVAQNIPHYFDDPEKAKPFPKTLDPSQVNSLAAKQAYETARRIPEVLVQQPCYCYCDRGFGHGSLLDCHKDNHSAD